MIDNQNIINVKRHNDLFLKIYKHIIVRFDEIKIEFFHENRKMLISDFKKLLQIIKDLIQFINLNIIFIEIVKLLHINVFLNIIIKKTDFDVYLFHVSIHNRRKRKNRFIIYKLHYRRENVIIIMILLLFESSNNLMCFITNNFSREISFYDINSITFQNTNS